MWTLKSRQTRVCAYTTFIANKGLTFGLERVIPDIETGMLQGRVPFSCYNVICHWIIDRRFAFGGNNLIFKPMSLIKDNSLLIVVRIFNNKKHHTQCATFWRLNATPQHVYNEIWFYCSFHISLSFAFWRRFFYYFLFLA